MKGTYLRVRTFLAASSFAFAAVGAPTSSSAPPRPASSSAPRLPPLPNAPSRPTRPPPKPPVGHPIPRPSLTPTQLREAPSLTLVRAELGSGLAIVTHELAFSANALVGSPPRLFVSFPAQARPLGFEATWTGAVGSGTPHPIEWDESPSAPTGVPRILGPADRAGLILELPSTDGAFVLRLRTVVPGPWSGRDPRSRAGLIVPLSGAHGPARIDLTALPHTQVLGARATLCPGAQDPRPATVHFPPAADGDRAGTVEPTELTRGDRDELCLDVWLRSFTGE